MNRTLFIFLYFLCAVCLLSAQDIILKINGDEIQSKVAEIGLDEVKYHRFDNLTGPVYTIKKSEIFMITYEDGSKDIFGKQQQQLQPQTVTAPATVQQPKTEQTVSLAEAKQGDMVDINGQKAIVFQTYGGGHGKAMCIKALRGVKDAWSRTNAINRIHTVEKENGRANTEAILRFIEENHLNINDFPAMAWCRQLGAGWYIPSLKEMETFVNWWLGNEVELDWDDESTDEAQSPAVSETSFSKQVNKQLLDAGGIPFLNGAFTSTENERGRLSVFWYNERKGFWQFGTVSKTGVGTMYLGRAFFEF
jgi:hypothetical protein